MQCVDANLKCKYFVVNQACRSTSTSSVATVAGADSTHQNHSWNENTAGSGLSNEFASTPTEADKFATIDKTTVADRSDEVANVWRNMQANYVASANFDTSTAVANDAGPQGVTEKLETQSHTGRMTGRILDLLYSKIETSVTQVPARRRETTGLPAALMFLALNRSGHNRTAGTNFTEGTSLSWLREANRGSTPVELMSEEMGTKQVENVFIQPTNAIAISSLYSSDNGLKPEQSTTRQSVNMHQSDYQLQPDLSPSSSSSGGAGGEEDVDNESESHVLTKPRGGYGGSLEGHGSSRDNRQHLMRPSGQQGQRHDDGSAHGDEVRMN